jgi:hypothetical protein
MVPFRGSDGHSEDIVILLTDAALAVGFCPGAIYPY